MIKTFILSNFHKFNHFIEMKPGDDEDLIRLITTTIDVKLKSFLTINFNNGEL